MKTLDYKTVFAVAFLLLVVGVFSIIWQKSGQAIGSIVEGQEYYSTSTRNFNGTALTNLTRLKDGGNACVSGSLARVTVSGSAGPSIIRFWDATTTDANLRAARYASSTIFITEVSLLTATGTTLDFDARFSCGLIYELVSGSAATSSVLWR